MKNQYDIAFLKHEITVCTEYDKIVIGYSPVTDNWSVFHKNTHYRLPGEELEFWFAKPTLHEAFAAVGATF